MTFKTEDDLTKRIQKLSLSENDLVLKRLMIAAELVEIERAFKEDLLTEAEFNRLHTQKKYLLNRADKIQFMLKEIRARRSDYVMRRTFMLSEQ